VCVCVCVCVCVTYLVLPIYFLCVGPSGPTPGVCVGVPAPQGADREATDRTPSTSARGAPLTAKEWETELGETDVWGGLAPYLTVVPHRICMVYCVCGCLCGLDMARDAVCECGWCKVTF
jgi:hypothetical protein